MHSILQENVHRSVNDIPDTNVQRSVQSDPKHYAQLGAHRASLSRLKTLSFNMIDMIVDLATLPLDAPKP